MPKPTIKALEERILTLKELHSSDCEVIARLKTNIEAIKCELEMLRADKTWLKQMHSAVLQSMHEFIRGGRH